MIIYFPLLALVSNEKYLLNNSKKQQRTVKKIIFPSLDDRWREEGNSI
jgi:hypothetical protein